MASLPAPYSGKPAREPTGGTGRTGWVALTLAVAMALQLGVSAAQTSDDHPYFTGEFSIREGQGPARISVRRDSGGAAVTVRYATKPSDAKQGADFSPAEGHLSFSSGDNGPKTFDVQVVDDTEPEEEESVLLFLYDSGGQIIDFSELVIVSDESVTEDGDDGPGQDDGQGTTASGAGPGASKPGTGSRSAAPGPQGPGSGPAAPSAGAAGAQDIPTIELVPRPEAAGSGTGDGQKETSLASPPERPPRPSPIGLVALAAAALAAAGSALYFIWSRRSRTLNPPA